LCTFFVLFAVSFSTSNAEVIALTPDTFSSVVGSGKPAFVEFYAPWCGHCKKLAPEYEIVGEAFGRYSDSVSVTKVDCDAHSDLCRGHGVSGYPTLKWFDASGSAEGYNEGRTAEEIISFINDKTGLGGRVQKAKTFVVELDSSNFDQIVLDKSKNVFVKFYAPWCGHCKTLAPDWDKLAKAFSNEPNVVVAKLDATKFPDLGSRYSVTGYPTLIFFGAENEQERYEGARTLNDLISHLNEKSETFRHESGKLNERAGRIAALDEIASQFLQGDRDALLTSAREVAQQHQDKLSASLYVKLFEKIKTGGDNYLDSEIKRLTKMSNSNSVAANKQTR